MNLLKKIEKLDDNELEKFVKKRIALLELKKRSEMISNTVGFLLDYNPSCYDLLDCSDEICEIPIISKFDGYIPLGTRIVYGMYYNINQKIVSNNGYYYYMNDDKYILEFCKYIKNKKVFDEFELFDYLLEFCQKYFGTIEFIKREDMKKLINVNDRAFYKPINEHGFSLFKNKGNYQCSEISIMVQNILSFLGFNISLIIGKEQLDGCNTESHAFNFIDFNYSLTKEKLSLLFDAAIPVNVVDINCNVVGLSPYIHYLDKSKDETYYDLSHGITDEINCEDYNYVTMLDRFFTFGNDSYRHYSLGLFLKQQDDVVQKVLKK